MKLGTKYLSADKHSFIKLKGALAMNKVDLQLEPHLSCAIGEEVEPHWGNTIKFIFFQVGLCC